MYQLKKGQESFTVVEGPMAGRSFRPGQTYTDIPAAEARRFAEVRKLAGRAAAAAPPAKVDSKKEDKSSFGKKVR